MSNNPIIATVLGHYAIAKDVRQILPVVSAQSFSGAQLWRLTTPHGHFLLRRWPEDSDAERIIAIHQVLRFVGPQLNGLIAAPLLNNKGTPEVFADGEYWSLSPWLDGIAEVTFPSSQKKIENALRSLAKFHQVAVMYADAKYFASPSVGVPSGIQDRMIKVDTWLRSGCGQVLSAVNRRKHLCTSELRRELVELFLDCAPKIVPELKQAAFTPVPLQICLRDVWRAHVLFRDDEVTGIIDYDALRVDSVATDIARLLGSMAGDEMNLWTAGLVAYAEVRPLSEPECRLIIAYDRSAVLLTGMQWLEWLFIEQREFTNPTAVMERLTENLARLRHLNSTVRFEFLTE